MPEAGQPPRVVPCDYDTGPGRWAANQAFRPPDTGIFALMTQRIIAGAAGPVLELGGGTGPLARELAGHGDAQVIVADLAQGLLSQAPRPAVRTGARAAGFQAGSFGTVVALWMLYHLPEPGTRR